jgi:hypothetical protein
MEDEKFRQELDELFRLFKKLMEDKSIDEVPGIDKNMLQQFRADRLLRKLIQSKSGRLPAPGRR